MQKMICLHSPYPSLSLLSLAEKLIALSFRVRVILQQRSGKLTNVFAASSLPSAGMS